MISEKSTQALVSLGFTNLEAEVYAALLQSSPATGYGVAQMINKPLSNVYKTIETLQYKGAILIDEGENRICRAVPADELLSRLERSFRENKQRAAEALNELKDSPADDRIYQLRSREQVMERCRQMLQACEDVALIDVFPDILEELRPDIEAVIARGKKVGVQAYLNGQVEGAEIFTSPAGQKIVNRWAGQWLCLVVDGAEFLMAFLSSDGKLVHQAVWSKSPFISWVYYGSLYAELVFSRLQSGIEEGLSSDQLLSILESSKSLLNRETRGYRDLIRRFAGETG